MPNDVVTVHALLPTKPLRLMSVKPKIVWPHSRAMMDLCPVSYTHLTLPTSDLV